MEGIFSRGAIMFFTYKFPVIKILVALIMLVGVFNTTPTSMGAEAAMQSGATARFAVIGDFGKVTQGAFDVANLVKSWNPEFIITTGDNNYPNGEAATIDENIGQYYHQFIHPYTGSYGAGATTNRFFPALGNHDWNTPNALPYLNYFTLPGNERYYDFVWGPIHFFVIDSDPAEPHGNTSTSIQAMWLKGKLAASTAPWQIVSLHHPPYSSGSTHGSFPDLQWPFTAWGADVVLAGHDHLYERLFRDGIPYFVNGLGGHPTLYPFGAPIPGSQKRYNSDYGAMLVDASATQIIFKFITRTGLIIDSYTLNNLSAKVNVDIGGVLKGSYDVAHHGSLKLSYSAVDSGPVKMHSTNGVPIVASERVAYTPDGGTTWTSYSELMGLPANQLTTSYTFPWYNNVDLNSQLRFGNVGTANTVVTVTVGGVFQGSYNLAPNASTRISYPGLDSGPVKVTSSGGVPIIASMRVAYFDGSAWTSFSEIMGLPSNKLTHSYIFPWYNNTDLNSQLRFGNVGTANTNVTVTVGGVFKGSYHLAPNQSKRISYPGLDGGPVKVQSSGNVPIIASMRVAYHNGSVWTDFSEMMGLPFGSLSTRYSFPVYNNINLNSQLRFGNAGTANTIVTVTIGGVLRGSYALAPNESKRISYAGLDGGPVVIASTGGVPIIASERVAYHDGTAWTSFAEMMGLPHAHLTTTFVFPWYNNVDLNTQLRFGVP